MVVSNHLNSYKRNQTIWHKYLNCLCCFYFQSY